MESREMLEIVVEKWKEVSFKVLFSRTSFARNEY